MLLLCPLWNPGDGDAREAVIDKFHELACLQPSMKKELERLSVAADAAKVKYAEQWLRAVQAVGSDA